MNDGTTTVGVAPSSPRRRSLRWIAGAVVCLLSVAVGDAQDTNQPAAPTNKNASPTTHRSRNFTLHTDLAKRDAEVLLKRLEDRLLLIEKYWGRRLEGDIECYVAVDVASWPDAALPNRLARLIIARIGGGSTEVADTKNRRRTWKTVVFASAKPGIVEHEIVHAYCVQTFGAMGPMWYREGMAEIVNLGHEQDHSVRCPPEYVQFFRKAKRLTVQEMLDSGSFTSGISDTLTAIKTNSIQGQDRDDDAVLEAWTERDTATVALAREAYRHSWAFCYMLSHNSNYGKRFRTLGKSYLTHRGDSFSHAFAPVRRELDFEYQFFIERFDVGYDVELCRWDWATRFHTMKRQQTVSTKVDAKRGYQASAILVSSGVPYTYRTSGHWMTSPEGARTDGDGADGGKGRLVGVVMDGYSLGKPFPLGANGVFTPRRSGKLFFRCQDYWNQLADNRGCVTVVVGLKP